MALVHTPEVDPERKPESTSRGAISVSLEGRCHKRRPSAFSPSESKPTRRVISRTEEARLCPIHTTSYVNPDLPRIGVLDRIRLGQRYWFGLRTNADQLCAVGGRQSICPHSAHIGPFAETSKIQVMPDFIGERGGTRTLDPMIKSHVLYHLSYALTCRAV